MPPFSPLKTLVLCLLFLSGAFASTAQPKELDACNIIWNAQSKNAGESMPCGGGDVGLNVWVENGELLLYASQSGAFDENNALLKLGRVRLKLSPNPFEGNTFRQELVLRDGCVKVSGNNGALKTEVTIWVDVFHPVAHLSVNSNQPTTAEVGYESWRYQDLFPKGKENNANSYKWAPPSPVITHHDSISFQGNKVVAFHRNQDQSVFDVTVAQEGMESVKAQLFNPLKNLTFGVQLEAANMIQAGTYDGSYQNTPFKGWKLKSARPSRTQEIALSLHTAQTNTLEEWLNGLNAISSTANIKSAFQKTKDWWRQSLVF